MKITYRIFLGGFLAILIIPIVGFGLRAAIIHAHINTDISTLYQDSNLSTPRTIANTPTISQTITCGYATIQWITAFMGNEISEQTLFDANDGIITTAFPDNFGPELQKYLGNNYRVTTLKNATDLEILTAIADSLRKGFPVPISFAALDPTNYPNYSLHYSIVTGMDLGQDRIYVSNVYGYEEIYSVADFLDALKFNNYTNMPFPIRMGVFFAVFDRNTIYLVDEVISQ